MKYFSRHHLKSTRFIDNLCFCINFKTTYVHILVPFKKGPVNYQVIKWQLKEIITKF